MTKISLKVSIKCFNFLCGRDCEQYFYVQSGAYYCFLHSFQTFFPAFPKMLVISFSRFLDHPPSTSMITLAGRSCMYPEYFLDNSSLGGSNVLVLWSPNRASTRRKNVNKRMVCKHRHIPVNLCFMRLVERLGICTYRPWKNSITKLELSKHLKE